MTSAIQEPASTAAAAREERGSSPGWRPRGRDAQLWALGLLVWTALAVLSAVDRAALLWSLGEPVAWTRVLASSSASWFTCAVFTPFYFRLVRRWPLERRSAAPTLALYALCTAAVVVLRTALYLPLANSIAGGGAEAMVFRPLLARDFLNEYVAFGCLLAVVLSIEYHHGLRERDVQAVRLRAQLTEARLDALAAQLHPHFLFNTIQGISTLIHRDPAAADAMLVRLGALLRHSLRQEEGHEIALAQEMELLELYLGIVRARFEDRLTVEVRVDPGVLDAAVPRFLLQPLVENALQHGIARRAGGGRIRIDAAREAGELVVRVADDGPGPGPGSRAFPAEGIGLGNTRTRLAEMYGGGASLEAGPEPAGGFRVTIRLPLRAGEAAG